MLVAYEAGVVVLDRESRNRDALVSCHEVDRLVPALRFAAEQAEKLPAPKNQGRPWGVQVQSYDGFVAIRFTPPPDETPKRVTMPAAVAKKFADLVEFSGQQARHKMRFEIRH